MRAIIIDEPKIRNYIVETEEGGRYRHNQKFLKLLPNPNPVTEIEPPEVILKKTCKPEVELDMPRWSAHERAPPKRFDDECAAAEVKRRVKYERKERKTVRFCDGPPKCSFSGQQNQLKIDGGSSKENRKRAENRIFLKKTLRVFKNPFRIESFH